MMSPWYASMGIMTLGVTWMEGYAKPGNVDISRIPDPTSPMFQFLLVGSLFIHLFLWPAIWGIRLLEVLQHVSKK